MNIFTMVSRAAQNLPLTPFERALLKLAEGALWAAVLAALGVVGTLATSGQLGFNPTTQALVVGAGAAAFLAFVKKYIAAHGDLFGQVIGGTAAAPAAAPAAIPVAAPSAASVPSVPSVPSATQIAASSMVLVAPPPSPASA